MDASTVVDVTTESSEIGSGELDEENVTERDEVDLFEESTNQSETTQDATGESTTMTTDVTTLYSSTKIPRAQKERRVPDSGAFSEKKHKAS